MSQRPTADGLSASTPYRERLKERLRGYADSEKSIVRSGDLYAAIKTIDDLEADLAAEREGKR